MIPLKSPKIDSQKNTFMSLNLRSSKNVLQIGEPKVSKSKFMHSLQESKSILHFNKRLLLVCFVKNVAFFFIGTPCRNKIYFLLAIANDPSDCQRIKNLIVLYLLATSH